MTATNEVDAALCHAVLPDEFSRLTSSSPPRERLSMAVMLSGIVPASEQDEVICPLLLRRRMIIPAWRTAFAAGVGRHV